MTSNHDNNKRRPDIANPNGLHRKSYVNKTDGGKVNRTETNGLGNHSYLCPADNQPTDELCECGYEKIHDKSKGSDVEPTDLDKKAKAVKEVRALRISDEKKRREDERVTDLDSEIDEIRGKVETGGVMHFYSPEKIKALLTKQQPKGQIKNPTTDLDWQWNSGHFEGYNEALADAKLWAYHHLGLDPNSSMWEKFGSYDESKEFKKLKGER